MYNVEDKPVTIKKNVDSKNGLDFYFLKVKGIEYIEQLGRKLWTNYNLSDSGIAFLEVLIYGITDLELRISQPIQDILATEFNAIENHKKQFHSAKSILTSAPVTELDYRKLFIDIKGVKNVWIEKYKLPIFVECNPKEPKYSFDPIVEPAHKTGAFNIKGLYSLLVEFEEKGFNKIQVYNEIIDKYHKNRNLCEDLAELKEVCFVAIKVCANIQIESEANEEFIDAEIQFVIENYLSPHVGTYTLSELLDKDISTEEIFNGPQLANGFIDNEELIASQLGKDVRLSDIINLIMNIEGVKYIEDIQIISINEKGEEECRCDSSKETFGDDWIICIPDGFKASFSGDSNLQYKKGFLGVHVNQDRQKARLEELRNTAYTNTLKTCDDLPPILGQYNDLSSYWSVQNNLPENYGVGENELPSTSSEERKIQAKQLKAYLLLMEQVLATYFAQLGSVTTLFSTQLGSDALLNSNYAPNLIDGINNRDELVGNDSAYLKSLKDEFILAENYELRRNEILNHLFARFAENFSAYGQSMSHLHGTYDLAEAINDKNEFLDNYASYSYRRNLAFNYYGKPIWNTSSNLPGIQDKIGYTIGLEDKRRHCPYPPPIDDDLQEGMFAIENILLLPTKRNFITSGELGWVDEDDITFYQWKIQILEEWYVGVTHFENKSDAIDHFNSSFLSLCRGLQKRIDTDSGEYNIIWTDKDYDKNNAKKWILAKSEDLFSKEDANQIISLFNKNRDEDAFDFCCFKYDFIDKTASLEFSPCALPCIDEECDSCVTADFFSYRMSFVFPGWTKRFIDIGFRNFMENLIYENLHAHILPRICWVGYPEEPEDPKVVNDMKEIQEKWNAYLTWKANKQHLVDSHYFELANDLLCRMNHLNNMYEEGRLHGCENEENEGFKKIILNQSTLGTHKTK